MCEIKTKNKEFLKHVGLNPEIYIIKTNIYFFIVVKIVVEKKEEKLERNLD